MPQLTFFSVNSMGSLKKLITMGSLKCLAQGHNTAEVRVGIWKPEPFALELGTDEAATRWPQRSS